MENQSEEIKEEECETIQLKPKRKYVKKEKTVDVSIDDVLNVLTDQQKVELKNKVAPHKGKGVRSEKQKLLDAERGKKLGELAKKRKEERLQREAEENEKIMKEQNELKSTKVKIERVIKPEAPVLVRERKIKAEISDIKNNVKVASEVVKKVANIVEAQEVKTKEINSRSMNDYIRERLGLSLK